MDTNLIVVAVMLAVPIGYWVYLTEWAEAKAKAEANEKAARE